MAEPTFRDLMRVARHQALHLETRDLYKPDDPAWLDWQAGRHVDPVERYRSWYEFVGEVVGSGVVVRRARVVSEPVSDYIRFEHEITDALNLGAGEQVRWSPRPNSPELLVPLADFWVLDETAVVWNHFSGGGSGMRTAVDTDPAVVKLCSDAFEAVWTRATPHTQYDPR